jgi:hypothetical protein
MTDFNVRSDAVDVEQIMRQIRARIREKRGVDYTEAEVQQLASVKLEKFLDPRGVRSNLVEEFRRRAAPDPANAFTEATLYATHRPWLKLIRRILNPLLKLFVNPSSVSDAMQKRREADVLFYEVVHNLVVELTRLGIEVHNLKMRLESLSSRMDFDERRARSLESVVEYRPAPVDRPRPGGREQGSPQGMPSQGGRGHGGQWRGGGGPGGGDSRGPGGPPRGPVTAPAGPGADAGSPAGFPRTSVSVPAGPGDAPVGSSDSSAVGAAPTAAPGVPGAQGPGPGGQGQGGQGPGDGHRRRRRRRRRRPGQTMAGAAGPASETASAGSPAGPSEPAGQAGAEEWDEPDNGEPGPDQGASDQ